MNGAVLLAAAVVIVVGAYLAKPARPWHQGWSIEDRGALRFAIPAGIVVAAVAMVLVGVIAAAPVPR